MRSPITEIFTSIQGEGLLLGCRQIFIRFFGCNLNCRYCDTILPEAPFFCRLWNGFETTCLPNPLTIEDVARTVSSLDLSLHHSVSLTGGEPLLQAEFIRSLAPYINTARNGLFLETNGTLPENLKEVIEVMDTVAMDIKLPSTAGTNSFWDKHKEFLCIAIRKKVYVKIVVNNQTKKEEFNEAIGIVSSVSKNVPLIIQPENKGVSDIIISPNNLLGLQQMALKRLLDVRIIPQIHKILSVK